MSSIPLTSVTLHGGCFCGSIRYQITIPPEVDRPLVPGALALPDPHPAAAAAREGNDSKADKSTTVPQPRYPQLELDHCRSCRRVCGSIVQAWIITPVDWVSFSFTPKLEPLPSNVGPVEDLERVAAWRHPALPASAIVKPTAELVRDTYLGSYSSNGQSWRSFCTRCGTGLTFYYSGDDTPGDDVSGNAVMDVALGTLAQECLEQPWLKPHRHCHWDSGTAWVREMMYHGTGPIPRHPRGLPTALVEEDRWMLQQQ